MQAIPKMPPKWFKARRKVVAYNKNIPISPVSRLSACLFADGSVGLSYKMSKGKTKRTNVRLSGKAWRVTLDVLDALEQYTEDTV